MKKKVLTTAMALAMLAPTATTFASTPTVGADKTVGGKDTQTYSSNLDITGYVNTGTGAAPEGQISVSLPTSVSFVVDENGDVITPNGMTISNNSASAEVDVTLATFTDSKPVDGDGITLVRSSDLTTKNRSYVNLALSTTGSTSGTTIDLLSAGVAKTKLTTIAAQGKAGLTLVGQAGTEAELTLDGTGATDTFTLVFEIAKKKN